MRPFVSVGETLNLATVLHKKEIFVPCVKNAWSPMHR